MSNAIDTVENVFLETPSPGTWTIEVLGDEIVQDAHLDTAAIDTVYALVASGGSAPATALPSAFPLALLALASSLLLTSWGMLGRPSGRDSDA